jgi:pimeloyl-ACP methyl ester carboxylesterase
MGDLRGQYRILAPQLVEAGFRVVSMDVRGHGESSTQWPDFTVSAVGSDILALIEELDAGPAFVIGNSMAAGAAIWAAAEAPERIAGLALLDPAVRGEVPPSMVALLAVLFARPWGPFLWQTYYTTLFPTRKPDDFLAYRTRLIANLRRPGRLESLKKMMMSSKTSSEQRIGQVTAPALVLMGSKDPDFTDPEAEARWVADNLHTTYHMIEGAGHYPHVEMPEASNPILIAWLQSLQEKAYVA